MYFVGCGEARTASIAIDAVRASPHPTLLSYESLSCSLSKCLSIPPPHPHFLFKPHLQSQKQLISRVARFFPIRISQGIKILP